MNYLISFSALYCNVTARHNKCINVIFLRCNNTALQDKYSIYFCYIL